MINLIIRRHPFLLMQFCKLGIGTITLYLTNKSIKKFDF